jgi:hypothetical protein
MRTVLIINTFVISIIIILWWVGEHWVLFFHLCQNQESNQTSSQCILVPWCSPGSLYECCIYIQINEPYECCNYQRVMKTSGGAFWNYMNVAINKARWNFRRCILKPYDYCNHQRVMKPPKVQSVLVLLALSLHAAINTVMNFRAGIIILNLEQSACFWAQWLCKPAVRFGCTCGSCERELWHWISCVIDISLQLGYPGAH